MENTNDSTPQNLVKPLKTKRVNSKRVLPDSQHDVLTLAENVSKKWIDNPTLTLLWINAETFKNLVQEYRIFLEKRLAVGSGRSSQTQTLKNLDKQINRAVEQTKLAILSKFGKEQGKAYYSEFGIGKQGEAYKLPNDRNSRLNALTLLVKAIKTYELTIFQFDDSFFGNIVEAYSLAFEATQKTDSEVASNVGNKNDLRKQIEAVLLALHTLIKINYPNTYEGEHRSWGFQKEKY